MDQQVILYMEYIFLLSAFCEDLPQSASKYTNKVDLYHTGKSCWKCFNL